MRGLLLTASYLTGHLSLFLAFSAVQEPAMAAALRLPRILNIALRVYHESTDTRQIDWSSTSAAVTTVSLLDERGVYLHPDNCGQFLREAD